MLFSFSLTNRSSCSAVRASSTAQMLLPTASVTASNPSELAQAYLTRTSKPFLHYLPVCVVRLRIQYHDRIRLCVLIKASMLNDGKADLVKIGAAVTAMVHHMYPAGL